ncbi:MAG: hypothetical protein ACE5KV_04500 [Thermoplasmata archaeon]
MREDIKNIVKQAVSLRDVPFPTVVEATSGHRVIPINLDDVKDIELIDLVIRAAKNFLSICQRTGRTYKGADPRNISRPLEEEFVQEMDRVGLSAERLGGAGYPDHKLTDNYGRPVYFETKVSTQITIGSARSFYYSSGKKIKEDAPHLLIGWEIEEESPNHYAVKGWKLVDLYYLGVSLKTEFNANNLEIYKEEASLGTG